MTKSEITERLNEYRKAGWLVYTFNSNKRMPSGAAGWFDHVLVHKAWSLVVCIEVKIGRDTVKAKQSELANAVMRNRHLVYILLTDKNADYVFKYIDKLTEDGR